MANRYQIITTNDIKQTSAVSSSTEVYSTSAVNSLFKNINTDIITINTSANKTVSAGQIAWNSEENTFNMGIVGGVTIQVGQEFTIYGTNTTSHDIFNGNSVCFTSAVGTNGQIHFELASKVESTAYNTIAIATQDIPIGSYGNATKYGKVRDLNTSSLVEGAKIYLGTSGNFTSAQAVFPAHSVELGYCISSHPTSGVIYVSVGQNPAIEDLYNVVITNPTMGDSFIYEDNKWINRNFGAITKESTGFAEPESVTVSYNEANRTITLGGSVSAYYRSNAVPTLSAGWTSEPHNAGVSATQFLYYNGSSIVWSSSVWSFEYIQIAAVVYGPNGEYIATLRETHGTQQWQTHREFHDVVGCYLGSGGDLSSYVLNSTTSAERRPLISQTIVNDEDLQTTLPALTTKTYTRFSLSGASTMNFTSASTDIVALNVQLPFYNQFNGSTWVQTPFNNNDYGAVFVFAMPAALDAKSQAKRFVFVQPQTVSTSLTTIQALTTSNVNLNGLASLNPELVFIAKIIIRETGTNLFSLISVEKLVGSKISQTAVVGNYLSTVSTDSTLTGLGTVASPLDLNAIGTSGTYTKVVTNQYGQVTSGGTLLASDIPILSATYLPLSGGTLTGNLTIARTPEASVTSQIIVGGNTTPYSNFVLNGIAASERYVQFKTSGVARWRFGLGTSTESGSDVGANLIFDTYTDAGVRMDSPIFVARASGGSITLARPVTISGVVTNSTLTASELVATNASKQLVSLPVATYPSLAELAYVKGVTSSIQTQLNGKAPLASPTFTGTVVAPSLTITEALETSAISTSTATLAPLAGKTYKTTSSYAGTCTLTLTITDAMTVGNECYMSFGGSTISNSVTLNYPDPYNSTRTIITICGDKRNLIIRRASSGFLVVG